MENLVPPPGAKTTPGLTIEIPVESKTAMTRTVGGLAAVVLGGVLAILAVQNRLPKDAAMRQPAPVRATASAAVVSAAERAARIHRDVFFSNFAESGLQDFGAADLPASEKATFAASHALINTPERVQVERGTDRRFVNAECVAQASERYFGDAAPAANRGETYLPTGATAPAALRFARVEGWTPHPGGKNDRFAVSVRVYEPVAGWRGDPYTWTMARENKPGEPKRIGTWNATVRKVPGGYNPAYRYVLLSWKRI